MANNFTGTTWYIDTPMAAPAEPPMVYVSDWSWQSMLAAGHRLFVQDSTGRVLIDITSKGPEEVIGGTRLGWVKGLRVVTIDSGNMTINVNK